MLTHLKQRNKWEWGILGLAGVIIAVLSCLNSFGFESVCERCGVIHHQNHWSIPGISTPVFSTSSEYETPVSKGLLQVGVVTFHEHQWLFSTGGSNGISCAIGEGRNIAFTVKSNDVAILLATCQQFGEIHLHDRLVTLVFDPKTSREVRGMALNLPKEGFTNHAAFSHWIGNQQELLSHVMKMNTQP